MVSVRNDSPRRSILGKGLVIALDPISVPLPMPDKTETIALAAEGGSEDLIIHDSEGEEDALCVVP